MAEVLATHRRGGGDPTYRTDAAGRHWRGIRTPDGPATLLLEQGIGDPTVAAAAWGPGAAWVLDSVPALLGAEDDPSGFEPRHPAVAAALRRHPHWRLGRTGLVLESLVPAIIAARKNIVESLRFTG